MLKPGTGEVCGKKPLDLIAQTIAREQVHRPWLVCRRVVVVDWVYWVVSARRLDAQISRQQQHARVRLHVGKRTACRLCAVPAAGVIEDAHEQVPAGFLAWFSSFKRTSDVHGWTHGTRESAA